MSKPVKLRTVCLPRLAVPYPPDNQFVAETQEIFDMWEQPMIQNRLGDDRFNKGEPYFSHLLDKSKLQFEVQANDDILFLDADTNEIFAFVYHGLLGEPAQVKVLNGTVIDHLNKVKKTMRDNDPGLIVGAGYTAGSLSAPALAWVNNLAKNTDAKKIQEHAYKIAALFAHIWNAAAQVMPKVFLDDFEKATVELENLRMDGGVRGLGDGMLHYTIVVDGEERHIDTADLAPSAGVCGINYGRQVHNEDNHNKYCLKYITQKTHDKDWGGSFFISDYGVYMPSYVDQLAGWRGKDLHGTGYLKNDPFDKDPICKQIGVAFVIPDRMKSELRKEEETGTFNMPEAFDPAINGMVTSTVLNDVNVEPKKRSTIPKRTIKTTQTVYSTFFKAVYEFPADHAYSSKAWTKKKLVEECTRRVRAGTLKQYYPAWTVEKLKVKLLENDGVEVRTTRIVRKNLTPQQQAAAEEALAREVAADEAAVEDTAVENAPRDGGIDEGGYEVGESPEEVEEVNEKESSGARRTRPSRISKSRSRRTRASGKLS